MKINKALSYLGIAQKAGFLGSGEYQCERCIKSGKAELLIIAADASEGTKKKFKDMCRYYETEHVEFGNKEELGRAIGKDLRSIIVVKDEKLARIISGIISDGE